MSDITANMEDSIKIALDAADMATTAASELDRIRNENILVKTEMKKIYRNMFIVLISALTGSVVSILLAAVVYYKTLSGMETANNTSLEALVIFAENVDRLTAATSTVQDLSGKLGGLSSDSAKTVESVATLDQNFRSGQADLIARVDTLQEHVDISVSQFTRSVLDNVTKTTTDQVQVVDRKIAELGKTTTQIMSILGGPASGSPTTTISPSGLSKSQIDEIIASLQKILLTQADIALKINGIKSTNTNDRKPTIKPVPRPSTDGMIKFP